MTDLTHLIGRLRELEKKATKGPWTHDSFDVEGGRGRYAVWAVHDEKGRSILDTSNSDVQCEHEDDGSRWDETGKHDTAFIAETRNALPQLLDALQSLTARVAELETKASLQWSAIEGAAALNAEKMRRIADLEAALLKICRTHGPAAPASDGGTYILDSSSAREMLIIARKALNPVEGE